jgi:hypothetical protein
MTMEATFSFLRLKFEKPARSIFTIDAAVLKEARKEGRARSL